MKNDSKRKLGKIEVFLEICYGKIEPDLQYEEILSILMSNITKDDIVNVRATGIIK